MDNVLLHAEGLCKTFALSKKQQKIEHTGAKKRVAVNHLSFDAMEGEIFGLLGPNGAGKTTTLRMLATLIKPDEGDAVIGGYSVRKEAEQVRRKIGFLTSELRLEEFFTPNYLFDFFSDLHQVPANLRKERKKHLFEIFGIDEFAEVKIANLSTGMKQKASLAISLVHDPDIVIFDEPTNGLDVLTARVVTDFLLQLKEEGKTVIVSTHIFSLIERICDRVGIIINGTGRDKYFRKGACIMNSTILTVMRKELARFFGDYRMVMTTILLPGILIFVLYQFMGDAMLSQFTTDKFAPKCTAVNIPDDWSAELKKNGFRIHKGNADTMDSARQKVKDQKAELCIVFPEDFAKQVEEYEVSSGKPAPNIAIYYNSASTDSANAYDTLCTYLDQKESAMANKFDVNRADSKADTFDMADDKDSTAQLFSSMLPFLLLIFLYSGCISVAPESIAGEKERGTIASLLITPVKRSHIALGKIAALSIIALLSGASSAIGTIASVPKLMSASTNKISGASYGVNDYIMLGIIILSTALVLVTLIALISAFAKTIKEAQTYVTPLMIVVMLIGITSMFGSGARSQIYYYLIPIYNSVQSMVGIFSFHVHGSLILTTIASNLAVTAIGAACLAKMFDSEYIMFHK